MEKVKKKKSKSSKRIYVNNKEFYDLLVKFNEDESDKKVYEKIGKIFVDISYNISIRPNFMNYSEDRKQDMISDAYTNMTKYIRTFDVTRGSNPFAYFSQVAFSAFKFHINKQKIRDEMFVPFEFLENMDRLNNNMVDDSLD